MAKPYPNERRDVVVAVARTPQRFAARSARDSDGAICHPDCDGQFGFKKVMPLLRNNGICGSLGRAYGDRDNDSLKSLFSA